jgi:hypothetical protein
VVALRILTWPWRPIAQSLNKGPSCRPGRDAAGEDAERWGKVIRATNVKPEGFDESFGIP